MSIFTLHFGFSILSYMQCGRAGDRTSVLLISGKVALPPEPQLLQKTTTPINILMLSCVSCLGSILFAYFAFLHVC